MNDTHLLRTCRYCLAELPIDQFRRRRKGSDERVHECRACHSLDERRRQVSRRDKRRERGLAKALGDLGRASNSGQVERLTEAMLKRFGGVSGLAEAWHRYHLLAIEKGGPAAYRSLSGMVNLLRWSDEQRLLRAQLGLDRPAKIVAVKK